MSTEKYDNDVSKLPIYMYLFCLAMVFRLNLNGIKILSTNPTHIRISVFLQLLTHGILVDSSAVICWSSPFVILGVSSLFCHLYYIFHGKSCKQTM